MYSHNIHGTYSLLALNFFSMALSAHSGPWPFIQFRNHFSQTVGLLGRVISPSQGRYLHMGQHKENKRIHTPIIHALSGIRTHDPSVRASEDSSYLRPRDYCFLYFVQGIIKTELVQELNIQVSPLSYVALLRTASSLSTELFRISVFLSCWWVNSKTRIVSCPLCIL
jgi:hypothetical protein